MKNLKDSGAEEERRLLNMPIPGLEDNTSETTPDPKYCLYAFTDGMQPLKMNFSYRSLIASLII
jgi:hypothetical protein